MFRKSVLFAALISLLLIPLVVTAQDPTATPEPTLETTSDMTSEPTIEGTPDGTVTAEVTAELTRTIDGLPVMTSTPTLAGGEVTPVDATPAEATPTHTPEFVVEVLRGVTIQEIVNDPGAYVDQTVELEGDLVQFINSRIFVLNEGATVASDGLLVINTTDQHLAPWVVAGRHYQLSGRVHYSINDSGGIEAVRQNAMDEMAMDPAPMSYDTVLMASILDGYEDYEIIEITDVNTVKGFATLAEIANDDVRYIGYEFFVVGNVGEFLTGNSFMLSEGDLLGEDRVLVTNADMASVAEGQRVKVYGHLARFTDFRDDPESGVNLTDEVFMDYETYNVLRAELVEVIE